MGASPSKGYNPNVTDVNDPRFTSLSKHSNRWLMANLIGEGDVYAGRGYEQVYCFNTASKNILVNDHVVLGNRCGKVIEVITDDADPNSDGGIAGIVVYEDMRYLPLDYRNNAAGFGYDDDATKVGRTTTYVFGKSTELEGTRNGSNVVLFQGSMMIFRQATDDVNTWNSIAYKAMQLQNRFANPVVDLVPPSAPVLTNGIPGVNNVALDWEAVEDNVAVVRYNVYKDGVLLANALSPLTAYTATGLLSNTTYEFYVTALDADGNESTPSNTVEITTAE